MTSLVPFEDVRPKTPRSNRLTGVPSENTWLFYSEEAEEKPLRILVVDDEPAIREVLEFCLSDDGYVIETAADGSGGLNRFRSGDWDLVFVDRVMPEMNGCELAEAIRQLDPNVPIIMVSGNVDSAEESALAGKFEAIVRKPFTRADLRAGIRRALKRIS